MPDIDPTIICPRLAINPEVRPVKQKPRKKNVKRSQAFSDEIDRLLRANFIRKTFYPDWLANSVLVKKNGKWSLHRLYQS